MHPKSHSVPHQLGMRMLEYISVDNIQLVRGILEEKAQNQNHEGLGPKWTISYQCGSEMVHGVSQQVVSELGLARGPRFEPPLCILNPLLFI